MNKDLLKKILPLSLTVAVILLDQITKQIVVSSMETYDVIPVIGDFFRIMYRNNDNAILGFGKSFPDVIHFGVVILFPVVGMGLVTAYYFFAKDLKLVYRIPLAGILGGGIGNLIDRFFRPHGVVDFLDFKFFGILGWDRFPTFNIADTFITICVCAIAGFFIYYEIKERKQKKEQN